MVPLALLHDHDVLPEQILAGESNEAIQGLVADLIAQAREALVGARSQVAELPRSAKQAFSVLVLVEPLLQKLEKSGVSALQDVTELNPLTRFFRLGRANWLGKV